MRGFVFLGAMIGALLSGPSAFAWGDVGHKVICQIAYLELRPEVRARVDALIAIDPKYRTFAESCTWPDFFPRVRPPEHFVNVPRTATGIDVVHPCPEADRCVVTAILNDMRDLALSLDVSDQLRLLKSLGHWVGDIHQPLHVSFEDDRGGNSIGITGPCRYSLHAVWDSCIIEKEIGTDWQAIASQLRADITPEDRAHWIPTEIGVGSVISWANESFAIAERPDVQYCVQKNDGCWYAAGQKEYRGTPQRVVTIDEGYLTAEAATVRERVKVAGVRLGAILNIALTPG